MVLVQLPTGSQSSTRSASHSHRPMVVLLLLFALCPSAEASRRLRRLGAPAAPTRAQARWQQDEIMALVHFNMATFFRNGDPGCDASNWRGCDPRGGCNASNPASFAPTALNVSNWADSMEALGVTEAVLTAKHGCGFYLWDTNVTLPDGKRYPYAVNASLDVVRAFSDTMAARGLGHGFYYSLTNNFFLNEAGFSVRPPSTLLPGQANVTQAQFEAIALASITELWTAFGSLNECWLDGGYQSNLRANISALLSTLQPDALVLNGEGVSPSAGRWSGTEGNVPPGWPNSFSTTCCDPQGADPAHACEGSGCPPDDPSGTAFYAPSSTDFTLQAGDVWFFEPGAPLRPLAELVATYHATVGANTVLELDFAIDRTGRVAPEHAALYSAFGAWRRACYGAPLAAVQLPAGAPSLTLPLPPGVAMDRVVLQEPAALGQCVAGYTLEVALLPGGAWAPFGRTGAHLIGNKRIELNGDGPGVQGPPLNASAVRFNVTRVFAGGCTPDVLLSVYAPGPCVPVPPPPPPPRARVRFMYADGRCLATNATFPCFSTSCPLFLADCALPQAVWDDSDAQLANLGVGPVGNIVNADCDACTARTLMKLEEGSPASIVFSAGQLRYACGGGGGAGALCLSNGLEGPPRGPCNPAEPFLPQQVTAELCSSAGTQGWARVPVP